MECLFDAVCVALDAWQVDGLSGGVEHRTRELSDVDMERVSVGQRPTQTSMCLFNPCLCFAAVGIVRKLMCFCDATGGKDQVPVCAQVHEWIAQGDDGVMSLVVVAANLLNAAPMNGVNL